jgi:hypothetical protein
MIAITINMAAEGDLPVPEFMDDLKAALEKDIPKIAATEYKELVVGNIDSNKFGFQLSRSWKAAKIAKGLDLRPFIATGLYKRSIQVLDREKFFTVGFPPGLPHYSGYTIDYLAKLLEFGALDVNIPPRPLWKKTSEEFEKVLGDVIKEYLDGKFSGK